MSEERETVMRKKLRDWKIGISYQRYGYITVPAETREEAIDAANERLQGMSVKEMEEATDYLSDSEMVDEEFVDMLE